VPQVTEPAALHDDPAIAAALAGLTPAQRETLLTTGGQKALAAEREQSKTARAEATAAKAAQDAITLSIGKALGLVKDNEPADPEAVARQLADSGSETKQAKIELAVFKAALTVGADPGALLDSRAFMVALKDIDPSDSAAVTAAITTAVTDNPRLGAAPGSRLPAPNPAQGSSANGAGPDLDTQIADATKAGNFQLAIALKEQRHASASKS